MHQPSFDFLGTTPFSAPERRAHARGAQGKLADTLRARVHTFSCFMAERFGKPTQAGVIDGVGNGRENARDQIAQRSEHCAARWRGRKQKQGCRRWSPSDLHFVRDQSRETCFVTVPINAPRGACLSACLWQLKLPSRMALARLPYWLGCWQ